MVTENKINLFDLACIKESFFFKDIDLQAVYFLPIKKSMSR
jgi:hypothetical protein